MTSRRWWWCCVCLAVLLAPMALGAKLTDAEKARAKTEKKLDAFAKEYDPSKNLSRKGAELIKDTAELDKELEALAALDAAAAAELKARRDTLVASASQAVGGAEAQKTAADLDKKFERAEKDLDPEKKNMLNVDPKALERTRKELDTLIDKLEGDAKKTYEARRDALFAKVQSGVGEAKVARVRANLKAPTPVTALPGAEVISPMKPTWCEGVLEAKGNLDNFTAAIPSEWSGDLNGPVLFSCIDADYDVRQQVMAAWRQKVSNALGLSAAMNERLMKLAGRLVVAGDKVREQEVALCKTQLAPLGSGTAEARANRALERIAVNCGNRLSDENKMQLRDIDLPGGLTSQLATAQVVFAVLETDGRGERDSYQLAQASDVAVLNAGLAFDSKQFEQQLDALQLDDWGQSRAILTYFGGRARLAGFVTALKALAPKVPGLQKFVFDAPEAAVKAFLARAPQDKELLETLLSLEAQKGAGVKGCAQKLWPRLQAELKGQERKPLDDLRLNSLLSAAMYECAQGDPEVSGLDSIFIYYAGSSPAVRGPLSAAYGAALEAYNDVVGSAGKGGFQAGRREGTGEVLELPRPEHTPIPPEESIGRVSSLDAHRDGSGAVVKALEKKGDRVKITFKTEKYIVPDYQCVETSKIDRITPEGQILYRSTCKKVGEHEAESTAQPFEAPAWAVGGIAPGNFVVPSWGKDGAGFVIEAYESKARSKRISLFGIGL